jgi:peptidoglycan-associated lipoprotein
MRPENFARWLTLVVVLLAFGALSCASKSGTGASGTGSTPTGSEFDQGPTGSEGGARSSISELQSVYFDYDRYEIRSDASGALRSNATAIQANEGWGTVTVEGHCDERGSEEYNLALGDRRANAVRRYLIDLGVPSSRLRTVSFGEARPAVPGHDENAWRYNRRSEFKSGT